MADDRRTENEEPEAPAEDIGDRAFRRVGPGGVMDHTAMMGTLDTTDTGAQGLAALHNLAPIFKVARAHEMAVAARALDPDDDGVSEDMVQVSQGLTVVQGDPEGDKRRVLENARRAQVDLNGDEAEFDPRFTAYFDRQAEAERAWVASMADMRPSLVVGSAPVPLPPPSEEAQEAREEVFAEQQQEQQAQQEQQEEAREAETTTVPQQRPASEPTDEPKPQEEQPAVEPKQLPKDEESTNGNGEDFHTLWQEASGNVKNQVSEKLTESKKTDEPAPDKPKLKKPNQASSKHDWIEWALQKYPELSRDEAASMTRLELIEYCKNREK